jgi:hypothetical protein
VSFKVYIYKVLKDPFILLDYNLFIVLFLLVGSYGQLNPALKLVLISVSI